MKLAIQTVLWGHRLDDVPHALDVIASHGCGGVEITQRPERLISARALRHALAERDLEFIGLSGGTLQERIAASSW